MNGSNNFLPTDAENPGCVDTRKLDNDQMLKQLFNAGKPLRFDWENKWLRGDQYAHILTHIDQYCQTFGFTKFAQKMHPENIYI